ncbi:MAG: hypothetical protein CBARDCOR_2605 [uncultured Caballeronia sp.]|nr:MAG: hypothetical protein CBARDCOR_2605 [uncultured Caballeronia sp.]
MKDRYLDFVNSPFGASVARSIGLPQPEVLRRHVQGRGEFDGIAPLERDRRLRCSNRC